MSFNFIFFLAMAVAGALALAAFVKMIVGLVRGRKDSEPAAPPVPTSLSFLSGLSFFSGLAALALVLVSGILFTTLSMGELLQLNPELRDVLQMSSKIVLYVSLLPSVVAVAFALAARGSISESGGTLRGRPLYRTGVLLAILSGAVVFDARVVNPATWAEAGETVLRGKAGAGEIRRAYLGVETGPLDASAFAAVLRVIPGSPADRAGLKTGDLITKVDGRMVFQLPPTGTPGVAAYSPGSTAPYLGDYVNSLGPGMRVSFQVRRGKENLTLVAELGASFASLLALVQNQSFDTERLAVLRAAGLDRRYTSEELLKICEAFDFDAGRLEAIKAALPHLQDPANSFRILGGLEFSDAKSRVSAWIKEQRAPKDE
jgi:hypothetical protein